jgi:hypothetical protein
MDKPLVKAEDFIKRAEQLISVDRNAQHGCKHITHRNISALWSAWLNYNVTPADVAAMMVLLKLARTKAGDYNADDFVDCIGYASIMGEIKNKAKAF